jgi:cytochrome c biogenesis protein CcdA
MIHIIDIRKIIIGLSWCFLFLLVSTLVYSQEGQATNHKLIIFYSPVCHKCQEVKNELMPDIEKAFRDTIRIQYLDITDIENYKLLLSLREKYHAKFNIVLPVFYSYGRFLNGEGAVKINVERFIKESISGTLMEKQSLAPVDLVAHFKAIKFFVVMSVGLIDGINPCAFTVIVFFISFLALQGYRRRELSIIGLAFIFAVFATYILIGVGLFSFLYRLEAFWLISRIINFSIGIFSIMLGILALYDFFRFKKTGQTEGLLLQLPGPIKNQIHSIIGLCYRDTKTRQADPAKRNIARLLLSALITGFLVSILEAVCTGQTYLPTIVFILKTSHRLRALAYLLLYNFMFVVPLLIIFLFALLGVTSEQFSKFLKERLLVIKLLMAVVFLGLGIFLIWRA